ncbi:S-adenosyl-L-methionine-dependent methyltransferase [Polyporus arcularius HHB13444]|uniref:S-adenosyl-L-methionine-dependent methyltransferase n=1 Tax=Polyporus arcularius HHB13444 TaxID=1314778 RepID=A0A5C3P0F0_9APHY|nr:S-adenosyl-L-methionine-dependent methyltransferase [Polyporus arcularius HHB13444]
MANKKGKGNKGGKSRDDAAWARTDVIEREHMHNERLEKYYKAQNVLPEEEWDQFLETMRNPLPTTFRVAGSRQAARLLNDTIKDVHVPHLAGVVFEGEAVSPPQQIPWYPEGLAWQFNVAKKVLRKSPEFKKFHSFLVFETEVGNVSRQEAVSMLPPLFLEVEPHHRVLDMCAAPGSKTAQLLEALHAHDTITSSSIPSGLLIANDSDYKRTHLLIHQSARLPSPALMVTNLDASIFPAIKIPSEQTIFPSSTKARVAAKKQYQLLFDRILCDVPCSGDGTLRKNPGIWKHWSPMDGNGLHSLQLRILQRAMRMLKKGGRIVYSTCSINPVENEAVVAAALKSIPGFELIDMSNHLPGLVLRPGLTSWKPTVTREINTDFATYQDYIQTLDESQRASSKMLESHWPPSAAEAESLHLSRCLRIYPHLQDTGGFFIAILQKKPPVKAPASRGASKDPSEGKRTADAVEGLDRSDVKKAKLDVEGEAGKGQEADAEPTEDADEELPEEAMEDPTPPMEVDEATPAATSEPKIRFKKGKTAEGASAHFKENPYTFIAPDDPIIKACIEIFDLSSNFPASNLLVRNPAGDSVRSLYMVNDIVKSVVQHNDYARIRLMTCGTKVFGKQEGTEAKREGAETHFRVLSEGLPVVLPYIGPKAIVQADFAALKIFMESYYPLTSGFSESFQSMINAKANGSYVVRFQPGQLEGATLTHELVLPIWKSNVSVMLMLDKRAKSALSMRIFGEDITTAAREAAARKKEKSEATPDAQVDTPVLEEDTAGAPVDETEAVDVPETA